ncbi:MAG TPA: type IV secretion system DNA-binding domain-containing protein [Terriglobales bacterium]
MNAAIPIPTNPSGRDRSWPRHRPVFSLLAIAFAALVATGAFTIQFKTRWSLLQQYYLSTYLRTAQLASSRNPYVHPSGTYRVLLIDYPRATRIALDSEIVLMDGLLQARVGSDFRLSPAAIRDEARQLRWASLRLDDQWLHAWLTQWVYSGGSRTALCRDAWYSGLLTLVLLLPLAIRQDIRESRKRRLGRPLKGANLTTRAQFHRRTPHHTGVGWRTKAVASLWEKVFIPAEEQQVVRIARQHEQEHILLVGDSGSGKSSLIRQLLIQIRDRGETAIVYDPAREYIPHLLDPDRGDLVLNPLDARMPYWNPSDELLHPTEADAIAKALFPDRQHENFFFIDSPRRIFAHLLRYRPRPEQLCDWIAKADPEIDKRVAGTPMQAIISKSAPQQREGVLGVLERAARVLALIPATTKTGRQWSATQWVEHRHGWVFLISTHETREALKPLISLWLDLMILRLTGQTSGCLHPVWVVIDEVASLENLPTLPLALAESRKANTRLVLGLQGKSQLETRYGKESEAMLSQPRTKIFLRTTEARAAEWVSKSIGEVETEHVREGRSTGEFGIRRSQNDTFDRRIEAAVLPSEIANLPDLEGYFQTPGFTLRLQFPHCAAEQRQAALIRTEVPGIQLLPEPPEDTSPPADDNEPKWQQLKSSSGDTLSALGM